MKRILAITSVFAAILICFCACSKSEAVKEAEAKINSIGDVGFDKLTAIEMAEKAYALLSAEDKEDVKNYDKLVAAREYYEDITDFADKAKELDAKLDKVLSEYGISYEDISEAYTELKERYDAADEAKKALYAFDEIISKAEEYFASFEAANASAVSYIKGFLEYNKDKSVTVTDVACISQVSDGTTYYLFALKYTEDGKEKTVYSSARFANTPPAESFIANAQVFFCDEPVSEKTDPFSNANVITDVEKILAEVNK